MVIMINCNMNITRTGIGSLQVYNLWSHMSLVVRNRSLGFPTRSHTNQAVQPQKIARGLKFRTKVVEGFYYTCSENKGADQLHGYREADLLFVFAYAKSRFSHDEAHINVTFTILNNSSHLKKINTTDTIV